MSLKIQKRQFCTVCQVMRGMDFWSCNLERNIVRLGKQAIWLCRKSFCWHEGRILENWFACICTWTCTIQRKRFWQRNWIDKVPARCHCCWWVLLFQACSPKIMASLLSLCINLSSKVRSNAKEAFATQQNEKLEKMKLMNPRIINQHQVSKSASFNIMLSTHQAAEEMSSKCLENWLVLVLLVHWRKYKNIDCWDWVGRTFTWHKLTMHLKKKSFPKKLSAVSLNVYSSICQSTKIYMFLLLNHQIILRWTRLTNQKERY